MQCDIADKYYIFKWLAKSLFKLKASSFYNTLNKWVNLMDLMRKPLE